MNKATTIFLIFISICSYADTSPEAIQFCGTPSNYISLPQGKIFMRKSFDKGMLSILEGKWSVYPAVLKFPQYFGHRMKFDKKNRPVKYIGHQVDLNKDGKDEYFIIIPGVGSGGPIYAVLSLIDGKWREIGDFQGWSISLQPHKNTWCSILTCSKSGQEYHTKTFFEFSNGKYRMKRIERFDNGKIIKKKFQ